MNIVRIIKWIIVCIIVFLLTKYLSELIIILIGSFILFSMLLPLKNSIKLRLNAINKWFKRFNFNTFSSILSILIPVSVIVFVLNYILPVIITQLNSLAGLSYKDVFNDMIQQSPFIENIVSYLGGKEYVLQSIQNTMHQIINVSIIAGWSSVLLNNLSGILINSLIILFITFHLLNDETLINRMFKSFIQPNYHSDIEEIIEHIKNILGKYFRGLLIDIVIIIIINSSILSLLGVKNSILIGTLSGIMNIIPYVGPLITLFVGLFFGVSGDILEMHYDIIPSTILKISLTLITVNIIDGIIIQPYIFSNVLKAHPLEIFLVIIGAGTLGGIIGMMLAIPFYVIIKVVLKEILNYWKNWT